MLDMVNRASIRFSWRMDLPGPLIGMTGRGVGRLKTDRLSGFPRGLMVSDVIRQLISLNSRIGNDKA